MGDHYALDFADDGHEVGVRNAMTTGWAAYSGACDDERALAAIEGGLKGIERANRVLLLETPFYEHSQPYPGRIADYPPGVRENGGQYSHGATWIVDGFMRLAASARAKGDHELAARLGGARLRDLRKNLAAEEDRPRKPRDLRPHSDPAAGRHLRRLGPRRARGLVVVHGLRRPHALGGLRLLGIEQRDGKIALRDDLFEAKGELKVQSLRIGEATWTPDGSYEARSPRIRCREPDFRPKTGLKYAAPLRRSAVSGKRRADKRAAGKRPRPCNGAFAHAFGPDYRLWTAFHRLRRLHDQ